MKDIEFNIKIKTKDMYIFQMRHAYLCLSGAISILISVGMFVIYLFTKQSNDDLKNLLLLLGAALFTIIYPAQMWSRAYKIIMLTPVFKKPLDYKVTNEGINISQNEETALLPWKDITKIIETKGTIYIYTSPKNGYIWPKNQYATNVDNIKEFINKYVDKTTCLLKLK